MGRQSHFTDEDAEAQSGHPQGGCGPHFLALPLLKRDQESRGLRDSLKKEVVGLQRGTRGETLLGGPGHGHHGVGPHTPQPVRPVTDLPACFPTCAARVRQLDGRTLPFPLPLPRGWGGGEWRGDSSVLSSAPSAELGRTEGTGPGGKAATQEAALGLARSSTEAKSRTITSPATTRPRGNNLSQGLPLLPASRAVHTACCSPAGAREQVPWPPASPDHPPPQGSVAHQHLGAGHGPAGCL